MKLQEIYRKLADQIRRDTDGAEIATGTAEITDRGLTYIVDYEIRREWNTGHSDYDSEPDTRVFESVEITDSGVYDSDGWKVNVHFDTDEISALFSGREQYFED